MPANCVVTGASGFVGQRLVEMLVERGAKRVVAFDIAPKPGICTELSLCFIHIFFPHGGRGARAADAWKNKEIEYVQGDISDLHTVMGIVEGADCVWHLAAAVGPYHPESLYTKVGGWLADLDPTFPHSRSLRRRR